MELQIPKNLSCKYFFGLCDSDSTLVDQIFQYDNGLLLSSFMPLITHNQIDESDDFYIDTHLVDKKSL